MDSNSRAKHDRRYALTELGPRCRTKYDGHGARHDLRLLQPSGSAHDDAAADDASDAHDAAAAIPRHQQPAADVDTGAADAAAVFCMNFFIKFSPI